MSWADRRRSAPSRCPRRRRCRSRAAPAHGRPRRERRSRAPLRSRWVWRPRHPAAWRRLPTTPQAGRPRPRRRSPCRGG
ncbi:MAG: hypothetical protein EXR69_12330 [Myxococcales bacterium]|nr:hypothetical protein [Myxococcales bacterium]